MNTITAIVTDSHVGGATALSVPEFETDDGLVIHASIAQRWLYDCWMDYWAYVNSLRKKFKARLIVIHLGDVIDGNHHDSTQLLPNVSDQERMAVELLQPLADVAQRFFILRGTAAHAGPSSQSEVRIAERLGADVLWKASLNIDGVLISVRHHGRIGKQPWTSSAASMAVRAQLAALRLKQPIPRYVLYGHNHLIDDSGSKVPGTRAIAMPCWQLETAYVNAVSPDMLADRGGLIMLPDGSLDESRMRYEAGPAEGETIYV